ncbi:MAG: 1-acyl-sn-glycerol-3-phosphate acyltransferase [Luteolibacter sp.]
MHGKLPAEDPVLVVATHRNGAVDGFLLHALMPELEFMLSAQLTRTWFQRLFFGGIGVKRQKDGGGDNHAAIQCCEEHLLAGGSLCVFPEGTSALGPQHLPYHSGAARIAIAYWEKSGSCPPIIPIGLHYHDPESFRSSVEVVVGEPLHVSVPSLGACRRAIEEGLLKVGANFSDSDHQELAWLRARQETSVYQGLKQMELPPGKESLAGWSSIPRRVRDLALRATPARPGLLPLWLAPLLVPGIILHLPVLLVAALASRRMADAQNVIALWKILGGTLAAFVWSPLLLLIAGMTAEWIGVFVVIAATALLLVLWNPVRTAWRNLRYLLAPASARKAILHFSKVPLHHV